MNPESWGFIGTLVGAIVGASVSIFTTRINSKNAIRLYEQKYNLLETGRPSQELLKHMHRHER